MEFIKLSNREIKAGYNRVQQAESLILQLPETHEGRNKWLMNYGKSQLAKLLRETNGLTFIKETQSAAIYKTPKVRGKGKK